MKLKLGFTVPHARCHPFYNDDNHCDRTAAKRAEQFALIANKSQDYTVISSVYRICDFIVLI